MSVLAAEDQGELPRWFISGGAVVLAHAAAVAALLQWQEPIDPTDIASAIVIELAPIAVAPTAAQKDVSPGPEQFQAETTPPQPVEQQQDKLEKMDEAPDPDMALALPKPAPEPPRPQETRPPAPITTAPQVAPVPNAPVAAAPTLGPQNLRQSRAIPTWKNAIVGMIERNKRYPARALARSQHGVAEIAFSLDRDGRVLESHIARSSGTAALDEEALAVVQRAQPFPPAPPEVPGARITITMPIRFNIRFR